MRPIIIKKRIFDNTLCNLKQDMENLASKLKDFGFGDDSESNFADEFEDEFEKLLGGQPVPGTFCSIKEGEEFIVDNCAICFKVHSGELTVNYHRGNTDRIIVSKNKKDIPYAKEGNNLVFKLDKGCTVITLDHKGYTKDYTMSIVGSGEIEIN